MSVSLNERPWILISAYDVSTGASSEGHVAFSVLQHLSRSYRIVLITRRNNKAQLMADPRFSALCPGIRIIGYDLPKWASWWKRGARFYQAYAYLWQLTWPLALRKRTRLKRNLRLVHVLNFHNDSIPSLAWCLGLPVVWGPINHNEIVAPWRRVLWSKSLVFRNLVAFWIRRAIWTVDPFLKLHILKSSVILSAGEWVDRRLDLKKAKSVIHRSQLGVSEDDFYVGNVSNFVKSTEHKELICAGRLDWIKSIDLAIEALALLPSEYRLRIVGKGPAEKSLRSLADQLGLQSRITFQEPVARTALAELYAQADLFIFTSAEAAGLVWVEALASGLPVVAFDGATEVAAAIHYLPGIQLAKNEDSRDVNIKSLATAIKASLSLPRNSEVLRASALKHYSWESLSATIESAYKEAMELPR